MLGAYSSREAASGNAFAALNGVTGYAENMEKQLQEWKEEESMEVILPLDENKDGILVGWSNPDGYDFEHVYAKKVTLEHDDAPVPAKKRKI